MSSRNECKSVLERSSEIRLKEHKQKAHNIVSAILLGILGFLLLSPVIGLLGNYAGMTLLLVLLGLKGG